MPSTHTLKKADPIHLNSKKNLSDGQTDVWVQDPVELGVSRKIDLPSN